MTPAPEQEARQTIDQLLAAAGWVVQNASSAHIHAARGVAIREFPLPGYGFADYLLYIDGRGAGVIESKKAGSTLTGVETRFTISLNHESRSRNVFAFLSLESLRYLLQSLFLRINNNEQYDHR